MRLVIMSFGLSLIISNDTDDISSSSSLKKLVLINVIILSSHSSPALWVDHDVTRVIYPKNIPPKKYVMINV